MHVGVPKEIKVHEYRVGLTPPSVAELTAAGHTVTVETGAGGGIDFTDRDYVAAGATIVPTAAQVHSRLHAFAISLGGGTSQIQRTIIAQEMRV